MPAPAIEIAGLRQVFRLYPDLVTSRIKQGLLFWNTYYREKVALDDVNLRLEKGEVVGVIGPNGAGKTTLLKIIAGISQPTRGSVKINGRVVAVLALGLGFHPRLTGLQNIDLAGMMLGMSREEIQRKRDWIVDFSELGSYVENPITSYSTGMRARLSFAVAACQDPEILIVDEALATGDVRFVQKCIDRIHEITKSGTTALFVSHNIWSIKRLTKRCILINGGKVADDGDTSRVADRYYEFMLKSEALDSYSREGADHGFVGNGEVQLRRVDFRNAAGRSVRIVNSGEPGALWLELDTGGVPKNVALSVVFRRGDGVSATAIAGLAGGTLNERFEFVHPHFELRPGLTAIKFTLDPLLLAPGDYSIDLHLFDPHDHSGFTSDQQYFFKTRILELGVRRLGNPNRSVVYYQPASAALAVWSDAVAN
jgi:ABC-type polysaccharide/polyol phosphate transport system ATPase subunit